jgi:thioesterase domain-containing protein/acyl carrier protein
VWGEVLGLEGIAATDNFFELGGHSLMATQVVSRLRLALGIDVPLRAVFEAPTVRELAKTLAAAGNSLLAGRIVAAIRQELGAETSVDAVFRESTIAGLTRLLHRATPDCSPLVTLHSGAGLPPLVCIHEVGGGVSAFSALADHLDPRRPVLGIHGFDEAAGRIEDAAARYAGAVAGAVPAGPLDLLGWSYGGLVAYEMARKLREVGREVRTLVLLDVPAPGERVQEGEEAPAVARAASASWGLELAEHDAHEVAVAARAAGAVPADVDDGQVAAWLTGVAARMDAVEAYRPRPYEGKVVLVRGTESDIGRTRDELLGWRRHVTGSLALEWAPGSHYSVVRGAGARAVAAIVERHAARTGDR